MEEARQNVTALLCARNNGLIELGATKDNITRQGAHEVIKQLGFSSAVIIVSRLAHYSIRKTAALMGLGTDNILVLEQTSDQSVCIDSLTRTIEGCRRARQFIIAIIGIGGATETGIIDPLAKMAQISQQNTIHFHVDAAWGGAFVFSDKHAQKLNGIECADTITFCAHKQLYTAQGLSVCLFKNPQAAHGSAVHADYQGQRGSFDMGQYAIEGSRPANSLLLHATLNLLGKNGIASLIDRSMEKTQQFRELIEQCEEFELVGEPVVNIINYRYIPSDLRGKLISDRTVEDNRRISDAVAKIQKDQFLQGRTFVSKTQIVNKNYCDEKITVFRVVLSNPLTTIEDLYVVVNDQIDVVSKLYEDSANGAIPIANRLTVLSSKLNNSRAKIGVPVGRPIGNTRVLILDEKLNLLPIGVVGEICISGECLSGGYLNKTAKHQNSFVPSPFFPGSMMYRTGDLGRCRVDGNIELIGRIDHQVKINGNRIELSEIEWHVAQLDGILDCSVVLNQFSNQTKSLTAYVVVDTENHGSESTAMSQALRKALLDSLPIELIPSEFKFVKRIPYLKSGKYQRIRRAEL